MEYKLNRDRSITMSKQECIEADQVSDRFGLGFRKVRFEERHV